MRWLRRPATSVSPQILPQDVMDELIRRMVSGGTAVVKVVTPEEMHATGPAAAPRPGIEPPGLEMPWPQWCKLEAELDAPAGWSACRFATRRPDEKGGGDVCTFVFGIVRNDFGIWLSPFPVCEMDDGIYLGQRDDILAAVTHLPSGLGMGVFADQPSAIASCDLADGLGIDWRTLNPLKPDDRSSWIDSINRLKKAREFAGITICSNRHTHMGSPDGPHLAIWQQRAEDIAVGRPEKLS